MGAFKPSPTHEDGAKGDNGFSGNHEQKVSVAEDTTRKSSGTVGNQPATTGTNTNTPLAAAGQTAFGRAKAETKTDAALGLLSDLLGNAPTDGLMKQVATLIAFYKPVHAYRDAEYGYGLAANGVEAAFNGVDPFFANWRHQWWGVQFIPATVKGIAAVPGKYDLHLVEFTDGKAPVVEKTPFAQISAYQGEVNEAKSMFQKGKAILQDGLAMTGHGSGHGEEQQTPTFSADQLFDQVTNQLSAELTRRNAKHLHTRTDWGSGDQTAIMTQGLNGGGGQK